MKYNRLGSSYHLILSSSANKPDRSFVTKPKPNNRKADSTWDYVVKGADVQSVWVENALGQKERKVDGALNQFNLRAKKVDPSKLGIDTVKQYSGYLDDEEEDKVS